MKLTRLISAAVIFGSVSFVGVQAQTSPGDQPTEFPPASFKGKQYVDSRGCVFIRAGIDGNVTWVPRVNRQRKGICGFKPTLAGQGAAPAPAPTPAVPEITVAPATTVAAAPVPIVRPVAAPTPKPMPTPAAAVRQTAPKKVVRAKRPVTAAPRVKHTARRVSSICPNATGVSAGYYTSTSHPVRCGPQTDPIIGASAAAELAVTEQTHQRRSKLKPIEVHPDTLIVPRHVAIANANTRSFTPPKGYTRVWKDGRLNPYRAYGTLRGHRDMQLIWTSTVPRRLINQTTGADVTAKMALVYPYTNYEAQQRELGEVTIRRKSGKVVKRLVRKPESAGVYSSRSAARMTMVRAADRGKEPYTGR